MKTVKNSIVRLMAITGVAALASVLARALDPVHGHLLSETIGLGVAFLSIGVLIIVLRKTVEQFPATSLDGAEDGALLSKRLMACSLVSYLVGVPIALGLHLAGLVSWIGALLYAAPMVVALAIALASRRAQGRRAAL